MNPILTDMTGSVNDGPFLPHDNNRIITGIRKIRIMILLVFIADTNLTYNSIKGLSVANKII